MSKKSERPYVAVDERASAGDTWSAQLFVRKGPGGREQFSMPKAEATRKQFLDAAHAAALKLRAARGKGRSGSEIDGNMLMRDLAAMVIDNRNVGGSKTGDPIKDRSKRIYRDAWRLWIGPVMGDLKVKQVKSAAVVEDQLAAIRDKGGEKGPLSAATLYQISRAISIVLDAMCRGGRFEFQELKMIDFFPKPEAKAKRRQVALDGTHVAAAMVRLENTFDKVRFLLGVLIGLRPGEMLALKWTDLAPSTTPGIWMEIDINATLTTDINRRSVFQDETKSAAGMRQCHVPMSLKPILEPVLDAWKQEQVAIRRERGLEIDTHSWFVMSNREGSQGSEGNMRSWFDTKIAQGILPEGFTPHNLRHTYGSHFAGANGGVASAALAAAMGHRDVKTAQEFYTQAMTADRIAQAENHASRMIGYLTPVAPAE